MSSQAIPVPQIRGHYTFGHEWIPAGESNLEVYSPLDGSHLGGVPIATSPTIDQVVENANTAFKTWSSTPLKERVQVLFRFKTLLEKHHVELADLIQAENGKTWTEAKAEIDKGVEVLEFACALPQIWDQGLLEVSTGVSCQYERYPLGTVLSIVPFNFPAMVPMWTIPIAIGCGNTFILKPSELVPLTAVRLAELFTEAGLPPGVFNVVHGTRETTEYLIDHPGITALSFVGSTKVLPILGKEH
jgi:malonate-semialdehyde dehydrogenase (acetylating)/methylmalonate-semialdehyde dehydrogenase